MAEDTGSLAVFIDFENLALGFRGEEEADVRDPQGAGASGGEGEDRGQEGLRRLGPFRRIHPPSHEDGIELIEIPNRSQTGKNSADIRLCVDAMDLAWAKDHITSFVIVSGDSDFSPLVSKLKENGKHVIGLGVKESTSDMLRDNCDEFIYYEDIERGRTGSVKLHGEGLSKRQREAFSILMESIVALTRENKEVLWSSMIKDTIRRKRPSFDESYYGYRTFSALLEDAEKKGLIELRVDPRRGLRSRRLGKFPQPEVIVAQRRHAKRKERHESAREAGIADPCRAGSFRNFRSRGKEVAFSDSFRRFQAFRRSSGGKDHAGDREESRGLSNYGHARLPVRSARAT